MCRPTIPVILDPLATLCDLVALPSVNPMGSGRTGAEFFERRVTDYLEQLFRRLELPYLRQHVEPERDNIIARIEGRGRLRERVLLLEAHQDTVPVDGMTIPPWTPNVRDGRIYGRGSCDIKGGMAAMLAAVSRIIADPPADLPTTFLACTVNEEHGFSGATALTTLWTAGSATFFPRRPDAAVVAEPTLLDVVVAHKGPVRWQCIAHGRAVHSSRPELGENAIFKMARVLAVLERYQQLVPAVAEHPLCGRPSLSVGTIHGGLSVNTVPDRCVIEIDRRLVPGEQPLAARQAAIDFITSELARHAGAFASGIEHTPPYILTLGLSDRDNGPLADRLLAAAESVVGPRQKIGVPYGTDAAAFAAAGVPSVVFGPGSVEQAHTADEWLAVEQLTAAAAVYEAFLRSGT